MFRKKCCQTQQPLRFLLASLAFRSPLLADAHSFCCQLRDARLPPAHPKLVDVVAKCSFSSSCESLQGIPSSQRLQSHLSVMQNLQLSCISSQDDGEKEEQPKRPSVDFAIIQLVDSGD